MEACSSAHHLDRQFQALGIEVRLISPQYVAPFVKTNKNDANDAAAIVEAARRPKMRFVTVKSRLQGISKRADTYLRTLLIYGARVVLRYAIGKADARIRRIQELIARRGYNRAAVAFLISNCSAACL